MKKVNKFIFYCAILILIFSFFFYSLPKNYHKVYNGIKYRLGNTEYEEIVTVELDGQYLKKVFSRNKFKGTIYINDEKLSNVRVIFGDKGATLKYWENARPYTYGTIYTSKNLGEITICVYESDSNESVKHWSTVEGLMITVPANNRDEALLILNKLMRKDITNTENNTIELN